MSTNVRFMPGERVSAHDTKQAGISWPLPIDAKLDRLLEAARLAGDRATRRDIVAALVFEADAADGEGLVELLKRYRTATVNEVFGGVPSEGLEYHSQRSGPRVTRL